MKNRILKTTCSPRLKKKRKGLRIGLGKIMGTGAGLSKFKSQPNTYQLCDFKELGKFLSQFFLLEN